MSFQLVNVLHPNAVRNTIPFLVFAAPDSYANLATTLRPYAGQIEQLQQMQWEDKRVHVVFFVFFLRL